MRIAVLGPLVVADDTGSPVEVGGQRLRALLARLALDHGHPVPVSTLIEDLWGAEAPTGSVNALQSLVSRLRRGLDVAVDSLPGGYRLGHVQLDVEEFERYAADGRAQLADGHHAAAEQALDTAERVWRGAALADLNDPPFVLAIRTKLHEHRLAVTELRFEAALRAGRCAEIVAELETVAAAHPLRERLQAQLMRALAGDGRQAEALSAYERVRQALADELGVDPSAELAAAHLSVLRGETTDAAHRSPAPVPTPARDRSPQASAPRTNIRAQLTSFVGREEELARIAQLLQRLRLVTLVGPGGAGKTRLTIEVTAAPTERATEQIWFVGLASVTNAADVEAAVAAAAGLRETALLEQEPAYATHAYRDTRSRLVGAFSQHRTLLVLDNCEHVIDGVAKLADDLLTACPELRILAASREPLGINGEVLYTVPPLAWPPTSTEHRDDVDRVADALTYPAVRLFVDRATAVRGEFTVTADNLDAIVEVCRRLDGMPLAIELAAAKVRSLPVPQLAERLDDRFRLLTGGSRTALPRHQTLRAVIEWSWDLLSEPERLLARRLAVFPSGGTMEAVERVCADERFTAAEIVEVLTSLVDKSLVEAEMSRDAGDEVRYRMLETVRAYGDERLGDAGERGPLYAARAAYFLELTEAAEPRLREHDQLRWLALLRAEYDNIITATRHAIDSGDADTAVRFCCALSWFWALEGNRKEGVTLSGEAIALPQVSAPDKVAALYGFHASGRFTSGDHTGGLRSAAHALWLSRKPGVLERSPMLRIMRPALAFMRGEHETADRQLSDVADGLPPWYRALAHVARSHLLEELSDIDGADEEHATARRVFDELGERWGQAVVLRGLATAHARSGDHAASVELRRRAWQLAIELGSSDDLPEMYAMTGVDLMHLGDFSQARINLAEALRFFERGEHDHAGLWFGYIGMAELNRRTGDLEQAHRQLDIAENALHLPIGDEQRIATITRERGWIALAEGDPRTAEALFRVERANLERNDAVGVTMNLQGLAAVAMADDAPALAAHRLGLSERVRGVLDRCNPDVDGLVAQAGKRLGESEYAAAYAGGLALSREDARYAVVADT